MHNFLKNFRRITFWVLPLFLLLIILQNVDASRFLKNLEESDSTLLVAGIVLFPLTTLIGAIRWKILLDTCNSAIIPFSKIVKHYWVGLATGFFTPGGIGMDLYRVWIVGKKYGNYIINITVVMVEKFMALFTCMSLIILLYPVTVPQSHSNLLTDILAVSYIILTIVVVIALLVILVYKNTWLQYVLKAIETAIVNRVRMATTRLHISDASTTLKLPFRDMIKPLEAPEKLLFVLVLSIAIQVNAALATHILFYAAGYEVPYLINLFLSPVFFFLFLMPVSFAGIGVREASFIILYGLFGVPKETALLVGFYSLAGTLLTNMIGVLLIYSQNQEKA